MSLEKEEKGRGRKNNTSQLSRRNYSVTMPSRQTRICDEAGSLYGKGREGEGERKGERMGRGRGEGQRGEEGGGAGGGGSGDRFVNRSSTRWFVTQGFR